MSTHPQPTITIVSPGSPIFLYDDLVINGLTPPVPVEHTQVGVGFTLTNHTDHPANGWVTSNWGGDVSVPAVRPEQSYRGTLITVAPSAGSHQLRLWYTEPQFGVEFPAPVAENDLTVEVAGTYTVSIDKLHAKDTRSQFTDTDFAFLALSAGPGNGMLHEWKRIGDVDDDHAVGITLGPVTLAAQDTLAFHYQVINHGHEFEDVHQFLDDVSAAAAQTLADIYVGTDWSAGDTLTKFINSQLFKDCDGYVAVDAIGPLDGARLNAWTADKGTFTVPLSYPQSDFDPQTWDYFYATGGNPCGTPHYTIYWTVRRTSWQG